MQGVAAGTVVVLVVVVAVTDVAIAQGAGTGSRAEFLPSDGAAWTGQ